MKFKRIIGIDPGATGGIAYSPDATIQSTKVVKMPSDFQSTNQFIKDITPGMDDTLCILEKITMHPNIARDPAKAMRLQKLIRNHEQLKTLLQVHHIKVIEVTPSSWQSELSLKLKGRAAKEETREQRKNRYKKFASSKFPQIKATLWNSDALILLYLGMFKNEFHPTWIWDKLPPEQIEF